MYGLFQHEIAEGYKCGICGDPYDEVQPRKHEIGGPYYKGYLVANYTTGSVSRCRLHSTVLDLASLFVIIIYIIAVPFNGRGRN